MSPEKEEMRSPKRRSKHLLLEYSVKKPLDTTDQIITRLVELFRKKRTRIEKWFSKEIQEEGKPHVFRVYVRLKNSVGVADHELVFDNIAPRLIERPDSTEKTVTRVVGVGRKDKKGFLEYDMETDIFDEVELDFEKLNNLLMSKARKLKKYRSRDPESVLDHLRRTFIPELKLRLGTKVVEKIDEYFTSRIRQDFERRFMDEKRTRRLKKGDTSDFEKIYYTYGREEEEQELEDRKES